MFKQLTALARDQHQEVRFAQAQGYGFASELIVSPVMLGEVALAAREMPVLFAKTDAMPIALLGLPPRQNAYIDAKGTWLARYVPAHIRRYPFMLAEQSAGATPTPASGQRSFTVMADLTAPHFANPQGQRLFDDQGQPTQVMLSIQKVLMDLQQAYVRTQQCIQQLLDAQLLVERSLQVQIADGKKTAFVMLPPYSSPRPSRNKPPGSSMAPGSLVRPAAS